jgi:tripartite-type tricarboxylate transporter receptor subunit TctC
MLDSSYMTWGKAMSRSASKYPDKEGAFAFHPEKGKTLMKKEGNMKNKKLRGVVFPGVVMVLFILIVPVMAAEFPTKPVTLIAPFAAGGSTDLSLRFLAEAAGKHLGQPIVVENKPGGAGTAGPAIVASTAKPDGYTVVQMPPAVFMYPYTMKVTWDPLKDFTYIIQVALYTSGLVVRADSPWKTFREFVDYSRAHPKKITVGNTGAWGSVHIFLEKIALQEGIKWIPVPMKGDSELIPAVLGGHVNAAGSTSGWAPQVDAGQLRLLVTFPPERSRRWPQVPTVKELYGIAGGSYWGIAGPKGMDPKVVRILHDAFKKGMGEPTFQGQLDKLGIEPAYLNSKDYVEYVKQIYEERGKEAEQFGLKKKK